MGVEAASDGYDDAGAASWPTSAPEVDRRPSVSRLAASLRYRLAAGAPQEVRALCLPLALLLARHLRIDAADSGWADRDRLVLTPEAAGLGQVAAELLGTGAGFFQAARETLGVATGLALAERMLAGRFGRSLVDHRVWLFSGGASLAAGSMQEAACLAGQWRLGRLTMIASIPCYDALGLAGFAAHGWSVRRAASTEAGDIAAAISAALRSVRPTLIACVLDEDGGADAEPRDETASWLSAGRRAAGLRRAWLRRLARHGNRQDFDGALHGRLPARWSVVAPSARAADSSTEDAVKQAITNLVPLLPMLSALPGRPGWAIPGTPPEQSRPELGQLATGLSAALAGLALHGGVLPVSVHRLDETDRVRPALAEAAREASRLLLILVEVPGHALAGGERAALRAMRDVMVFRPADASEALECLDLALRRHGGPSVLLLSGVTRPAAAEQPARTRCARGGYLAAQSDGPCSATLVASGPDLEAALQARAILKAGNVGANVVSLPCWKLLAAQDPVWRSTLLGNAPRFGIETGSGFGWERWLGEQANFIALSPDTPGSDQANARRIADTVLRHLRGRAPN